MNVVGSPTCNNVRLALMCAGLFYLNKWDMGQALVTTLKINKL